MLAACAIGWAVCTDNSDGDHSRFPLLNKDLDINSFTRQERDFADLPHL